MLRDQILQELWFLHFAVQKMKVFFFFKKVRFVCTWPGLKLLIDRLAPQPPRVLKISAARRRLDWWTVMFPLPVSSPSAPPTATTTSALRQ